MLSVVRQAIMLSESRVEDCVTLTVSLFSSAKIMLFLDICKLTVRLFGVYP